MTVTGCVALAIGGDQYLHRKFDDLGALNYRGYRGPVVGVKRDGEHRVGVFGGSAAMGYGLPNGQSLAGHLQRGFQERDRSATAINLAATGEQALAFFAENYRVFEYLQLDSLVFVVANEPVPCRIDERAFRDWPAFASALQERHGRVASYIAGAADVPLPDDVVAATGPVRQRLVDALNAALSSPEAVDAVRFLDVQARYGVDPASKSFEQRDHLACLTNLHLLQATAGPAFAPVRGLDQMAPSRRSGNPVFSRFNYWFILVEVGWEKYYLVRYGDISVGYIRDPLRRWIQRLRTPLATGPEQSAEASSGQGITLIDFVDHVTQQGKRVYFLLYPYIDPDQQVPVRLYLDFWLKDHPAVRVIDLSRVFEGPRSDYFLDGVHFSPAGNHAAASALVAHMTGHATTR